MPERAPLTMASPPNRPIPLQDSLPVTFKEVLQDELTQIAESRRARGVITSKPTADNLIGLAFSGGGIRSATLNLGVLQALAENQLLHKFDYLSTVSGGGYIGSWLTALTRRFLDALPNSSFRDVEKALVPGKREPGGREERTFLRWLRLYSNYLTPHTGALSGDTWAMIGTWLRNVFLNQTVLGLLFLGIFVACDGVVLGLLRPARPGAARIQLEGILWAGIAAWFIACVAMAWNTADQSPSEKVRAPFQRVKVLLTVILPFLLACLLFNSALWRWRVQGAAYPVLKWIVVWGCFYFLAWSVAAVSLRLWRVAWQKKDPEDRLLSPTVFLVSSWGAGAVGGALGYGYVWFLTSILPQSGSASYRAHWMVGVFGTVAVMLINLLAGAVHMGLAGRGCRDLVREWWARLGGYLMLLTLAWILLAGCCAFGPLLARWVLFKLKWKSLIPAVLWIAHNYLGVKAAKSAATSGKAEKTKPADGANGWRIAQLFKTQRALDIFARLAPYVFGLGLALLLATAVHIGSGLFYCNEKTRELWRLSTGNDWATLSDLYWKVGWKWSSLQLLGIGIILGIASLLLSSRVDVNDFSLHHFYRNRLVRCYLGASNPHRRAQPFTGFDPHDDVPLKEFAGNYPGPYPILNAAINITSGAELGYATRRAKSFVFTPLYCGYDVIFPGEGADRFRLDHAYRLSYSKTELGRTAGSLTKLTAEDGIALGTAMAISGAAASPNMGYFTSPATGLFMTLFDVRLGWWMGNSRATREWESPGPAWGLSYLFSELVAQSDQNKSYVYLSDGGHFENLAVYELIKRHCQVIVACDADSDGRYACENLLALIEKARTDFGARIEVDFSKIQPKEGRESECNFVAGDIFYDPQNPNDRGKLFYLKASMPLKSRPEASGVVKNLTPDPRKENRLPDDVWEYFDKHKTFPHQSTADQWFDELQFESYRALGEYIGNAAAAEIGKEISEVLEIEDSITLMKSAAI
jgi:predicted acylesterase/phospholipase RssA